MKMLFVALLALTVMPLASTSWLIETTGCVAGPYGGGYGALGGGSWPRAGFGGPPIPRTTPGTRGAGAVMGGRTARTPSGARSGTACRVIGPSAPSPHDG